MASIWVQSALEKIAKGDIDLEVGTYKAMLVGSGYTPDKDHDFVSDGAGAAELNGTGYQSGFAGTGRKALVSPTITRDDTNNRIKWSANNLSWPGINAGTVAYVVIYKEGTSDADSQIIVILDPADQATNGGQLDCNWHADGIGYIAA